MARKTSSPQKVRPTGTEVDRIGLYEELSPPWTLGSMDRTPPVDWGSALFGKQAHARLPGARRPKHPPHAA
jgi:hypothetical protein